MFFGDVLTQNTYDCLNMHVRYNCYFDTFYFRFDYDTNDNPGSYSFAAAIFTAVPQYRRTIPGFTGLCTEKIHYLGSTNAKEGFIF